MLSSSASVPVDSTIQYSSTLGEGVYQSKQEARNSPDLRPGEGGGDRNGSIASSKRSRQGQNNTPGIAPQSSGSVVIASQRLPDGRKTGSFSRFLSALNCCSAPDNADQVDVGDSSLPARKTSKLRQTSQGRQGTPAHKIDTSAADSSTAESKEMSDEKIGGPPYSHIKAAEQPKILEKPKDTAPMTKASILITQDEGPAISEQQRRDPSSEPSSLQPSEEVKPVELKQPGIQSTVVPSPDESSIVSTMKHSGNLNDGMPVRPDEDDDIVMIDAPLDSQSASVAVKERDLSEVDEAQSLSPAPPLATKSEQGDSASAVTKEQASTTVPPTEKQSWLLPPIRPEHHGKKCLVLDLDETLVHSSFKVSILSIMFESYS